MKGGEEKEEKGWKDKRKTILVTALNCIHHNAVSAANDDDAQMMTNNRRDIIANTLRQTNTI